MLDPLPGEYFRKPNRFKKKQKRYLKGRNHHHMTPVSRSGPAIPSNLLLIDIEKHNLLHKIFGNRTWEEIIAVMVRVSEMKKRHKLLEETLEFA
jgi:hypothetical protein